MKNLVHPQTFAAMLGETKALDHWAADARKPSHILEQAFYDGRHTSKYEALAEVLAYLTRHQWGLDDCAKLIEAFHEGELLDHQGLLSEIDTNPAF